MASRSAPVDINASAWDNGLEERDADEPETAARIAHAPPRDGGA
jgi:hypothetical protein